MRDDWTEMTPQEEVDPVVPPPPGVRALQAGMVRLGLAVLGQRALIWAASAVAAALWAYALGHPEPLRLAAASGYCLTVLAPLLWRDLKLGR